ncbi:MAG: hypothetical protein FD181_93 [Prolixibacteraceae bacterium]|nr:MAG: hypothetical protein FD181_93 [Prolixibacteraceae bacterium]
MKKYINKKYLIYSLLFSPLGELEGAEEGGLCLQLKTYTFLSMDRKF